MSHGSTENSADPLHAAARDIFMASIQQCNIAEAFDKHLHFEGNTLVHHAFPGLQRVLKPVRVPLDLFRHIRIIAAGKAAVPMLNALLTRLPRGLPYRALCAAPEIPVQRGWRRDWRIHSFAAGHPVPNQASFDAARLALKMLRQSGNDTFIFFLLSGGGSTLMELPLDESISLDDTIAFHAALVNSGADIHEINIVRKHFSAVKGGRLALAAPAATKLTLQIADVPLRHLDALASGPTIPDRSTVEECREVLDRYALLGRFPGPVRAFFSAAQIDETPGTKARTGLTSRPGVSTGPASTLQATPRPSDKAAWAVDPTGFGNMSLDTLLSSHDLVEAAGERAQLLGFKVVVDNSCDDWPYDAAALYLVRRMKQLQLRYPRLCLISGGEVTVRLPGASRETGVSAKVGTGGRNQQFALAAALVLSGEGTHLSRQAHAMLQRVIEGEAGVPTRMPGPGSGDQVQHSHVCVFSAGTDGIDGNSPVAGAIADESTLSRARALHFDPVASLKAFDACPLFSALGNTILTGKTGHNLRDLRLLLCEPGDPGAQVHL